LQPAEMSLVEKRMASRNLYKCGNCSRLAVSCTACKCMARVHEEGDSRKEDRLCLRCDDPKPEEVVREAWCSWCVNLTMQRLQKASSFPGVRNYYHCGECGRGCVPCRTCSSGSARGRMGATKDDDMCLLCCGVVQDWHRFKGKENRLMTFGWCSWCYEKVEHVLEQANKMTRHVYTCTNCQGRTLQCGHCREGMTRGARSWDDRKCAKCSGEFHSWEHNWQQRRLPRAAYMYNN